MRLPDVLKVCCTCVLIARPTCFIVCVCADCIGVYVEYVRMGVLFVRVLIMYVDCRKIQEKSNDRVNVRWEHIT